MNIDKPTKMSILFDYYGLLLTEKQRRIFTLYYEDNFSLSEIGDELELSRQGVHDALKKAEFMLEDWEEKLSLIKNGRRNEALYSDTKEILKRISEDDSIGWETKRKLEQIEENINKFSL